MLERSKGSFNHAIYMGFSLEQLQTTQRSKLSIGDFPFCIPKKRLAFDRPDGTKGKAPSHSNVISYIPGTVDDTAMFVDVFSKLGCVVVSRGYNDK